ncbi:NmrA family NAD(P)-binding protein [Altericroceibacterium spongiae]|nr:NmrA family NAD(P)-binding protein [Altericroceibacterium spongiae]
MTEKSKLIVLLGATGNLGSLIAQSLLEKPEVQLRVLVRPQSVDKLATLREQGVDIVEFDLEDIDQAGILEKAVDGAFCVISAIQGGPDIIVDAQLRLLETCRKAGVRRLIPSNFSYNIFGLVEGDNINSDDRRAFARAALEVQGDMEVVQVQNGAFLDRRVLFGFLGAFDLEKGCAFLWGDGNEAMDFTTYDDTARFTAEVATDDAVLPNILEIAGETLNFHELVKAYEDASGKSISVSHLGTLADLDKAIEQRRQAEPGNMYAWLPLMYWRAMLSGKAKLHSIANDRYPQIQPVTLREYVRKEGL